eukprot:scaffold646_cov367-Prasinococcus_capsulatus_cf.AAC.2
MPAHTEVGSAGSPRVPGAHWAHAAVDDRGVPGRDKRRCQGRCRASEEEVTCRPAACVHRQHPHVHPHPGMSSRVRGPRTGPGLAQAVTPHRRHPYSRRTRSWPRREARSGIADGRLQTTAVRSWAAGCRLLRQPGRPGFCSAVHYM